jgi:hypothetical protein
MYITTKLYICQGICRVRGLPGCLSEIAWASAIEAANRAVPAAGALVTGSARR